METQENKFQISQELIEKTQVKSSCIRFHLVKYEAFQVCFSGSH